MSEGGRRSPLFAATRPRMSFGEIYSERWSPRSMSDPTSKPPIPTTPKPVFTRRTSLLVKRSPSQDVKPKTINLLDLDERAELVRKSRKLARVFGKTPNAEDVVKPDCKPATRSNRHLDHLMAERSSAHARRYSLPINTDDVASIGISSALDEEIASTPSSRVLSSRSAEPSDPQSSPSPTPGSPPSCMDDSVSTFDNTSSLRASETKDRRRNRERLAKLHWFLGSPVPANLALGLPPDATPSLPPLQRSSSQRYGSDVVDKTPNLWAKRHRSKSVVLSPYTWTDGLERLKADLGEKEKAIIVRRAQKMEKVFGVAPPIALYHSSFSPTSGARSAPSSSFPSTTDLHSTFFPAGLQKQNETRPITPESSKHLLKGESLRISRNIPSESIDISSPDSNDRRYSLYYSRYAQSLVSLNDIIGREDVTSLAELHQALCGDFSTPAFRSQADDEEGDDGCLLPARTSIASLNSEDSVTLPSPKPDASSFQRRRKKAAKLAQFFGVNSRELVDVVLESIENGMHVDQRDGMLREEEVKDLLQTLNNLKHKRQTFV